VHLRALVRVGDVAMVAVDVPGEAIVVEAIDRDAARAGSGAVNPGGSGIWNSLRSKVQPLPGFSSPAASAASAV